MATITTVGEDSEKLGRALRSRAVFADWERRSRPVVLSLVFALLLLLVWQVSVGYFQVPPSSLPSPSEIGRSLFEQRSVLFENAIPTMAQVTIGFGLAIVLGVILGLVMSYSRIARDALYFNVLFFQLIPKVALAPLFMIWLGIGWQARLAIVVFISFFPMVISIIAGIEAADPSLLRLCRSLTANSWQVFKCVRLPASLPFVFNGMKITMTLALVGVVIAEFITSESGLGYLILFAGAHLDTPLMMASICVLCFAGLLLYGCLIALEQLVMRYYRV